MSINSSNRLENLVNIQRNFIRVLNGIFSPESLDYKNYMAQINAQRANLIDEETKTQKEARKKVFVRVWIWVLSSIFSLVFFSAGLYINTSLAIIEQFGNVWKSTSLLIAIVGIAASAVSISFLAVNVYKIRYYSKLSNEFFGEVANIFLVNNKATSFMYHGKITGFEANKYKVVQNKDTLLSNIDYYFFSNRATGTLIFLDNRKLLKAYIFQKESISKTLSGNLNIKAKVTGIDKEYKTKLMENYVFQTLRLGDILEYQIDLERNYSFIKLSKKDYTCAIKLLLVFNLFLIL